MAVTVTIPATGVSPNSVKFVATGSGGGGTAAVSRATILASLSAGPLKAYLTGLSNAQWILLGTDAKIQVMAHLVDTGAAAAAVAVDFVSTTQLQIQVSGNFVAIVEMNFKHSSIR